MARAQPFTMIEALGRLLLPPSCLLCGLPCPGPEDLCLPCRPTLRPLPGGLHPPRGSTHRPFAPFCYGSGAQQLVQGLKFSRRPEGAQLMATLMAEAVPSPLKRETAVLIPVPLHWRRRLLRGFDQGALLTLWLSRRTGLRTFPALRRLRATRPQSQLARGQRGVNLAHAFQARPPPRAGLAPCLIDDVATTGATLKAAQDALQAAGWAQPQAWVFAWTLPPAPP
jgi:ComF family protein